MIDQNEPHKVHFIMSYIRRESRGLKLAQLFFAARTAWAKAQPEVTTALISHREGNHASERAITNHGFRMIETSRKKYLDGSEETNFVYELSLGN